MAKDNKAVVRASDACLMGACRISAAFARVIVARHTRSSIQRGLTRYFQVAGESEPEAVLTASSGQGVSQ
jgi:hypothetical protein